MLVPTIGSQPYHGAVLVFRYAGDISDFKDLTVSVNLFQNGELIQENTPVQVVGDHLVAEIIDLKFELGPSLDGQLMIAGDTPLPVEFEFSLRYEHFWPWMDWLLQPGDATKLCSCFVYDEPDHPNGLGAHSSWDIFVQPQADIEILCGAEGTIYRIDSENVYVYDPYVGGFIQYGHTFAVEGLQIGQEVSSGDLIAHVDPSARHVHYSVY